MRFEGVDAAIGALRAAIDAELTAGMLRGAQIVADDARREHPYTNRTGRLESRTVPGRVVLLAGSVRAEVLGDTRYGRYVDEGTAHSRPYPFLFPAWERRQDAVASEIESALSLAARRAGWGP